MIPLCTVAHEEASSAAPSELTVLLQKIVSTLPPETHPLVLRHLPVPELARLSCVHKAFLVAWQTLQTQQPGERYSPPHAYDLQWVKTSSRLVRAAAFGDVAVIRSMLTAGVDEHGTPLLEAQAQDEQRVVDNALWHAARVGHVLAVELLLGYGADVHADDEGALRFASLNGHTAVVQLLLQHGADVHVHGDGALRWASEDGHIAVVQLLIQHGADVHAFDDGALVVASQYGHTAVVQLLIQHGANVHADDDKALRFASRNGRTAVVQLLIQHGANVHARNNAALQSATANGHTDVAELLIQHGARMPNS
jgi:ankyrin repeat protein